MVSGCFMYVLAVTTGDMPREGLSGSGFFTNAGSSTTPPDIYVAKVDLRKSGSCTCQRLNMDISGCKHAELYVQRLQMQLPLEFRLQNVCAANISH